MTSKVDEKGETQRERVMAYTLGRELTDAELDFAGGGIITTTLTCTGVNCSDTADTDHK